MFSPTCPSLSFKFLPQKPFPTVSEKAKGKMEEGKQQKHFVLVHGACHGAWCWYKVATRLRSVGHCVTALDMAAAGTNPTRLEELNSFSDYCRPLMEFMAALLPDETVVLVGHSMGGICISLAMEMFPKKIAVAVFVTAFMPGPDLPVLAANAEYQRQVDSYMDSQFEFANGVDKPPSSIVFGPEFMASHLYQLSPPEDLTLATLLVRPVGSYGEANLSKEITLSKENYGTVRRVYVVCERDNILKKEFQEWMIQNNPTHEVKMISGADHMVMFSKCQELCACLQDLARKYC
ncbi:putative hydrolase/acyltransferase (alpha/beta hydrolase superfamily) [Handroanthus impetiginosus]|uniref:Putative hydrolase/acyltransferase (Alpha/beta hydrolase superfamily) n=1 Tax=Handroanthus impetiginosus TaxID=429701 RepID=A0A2G9HF32_9LAMI|nr:putative hydrolase/acyltransferase (alpha/beta hydrolase superfamily) [Handroanthus impetiginosus]